MDLLEGMKQIGRDSITIAVFQDQQATTVPRGGLHLRGIQVTMHKGHIGGTAAILIVVEEMTLLGGFLADHLPVLT